MSQFRDALEQVAHDTREPFESVLLIALKIPMKAVIQSAADASLTYNRARLEAIKP